MEHSTLAIVRYRVLTPAKLLPGQVVRTFFRFRHGPCADRSLLCVVDSRPDHVFRLPAKVLLPLNQFLRRQPLLEFWALIHRSNFLKGDACFVRYPRLLTMGTVPHRFESEGECLYFLRFYALKPGMFFVAHVLNGDLYQHLNE